MIKIKSILKKHLIKADVLEKFFIDDVEYRVIDKKSILPNIKSTRNLCFKEGNCVYNHSSIHINPKYRFQPAYTTVQTIIDLWCQHFTLKNALVLGCAGCSIPRFIGLSYPESKTIGIELSKTIIEIAEKHFLLNEIKNQFELVHGDAIDYIKNYSLDYRQNIIYVDIFCENKIVPDILTESFIKAVYNCTEDNGLVIINILGNSIDDTTTFFKTIQNPFGAPFCVKGEKSQFLVLSKTIDSKAHNQIITNLSSTDTTSILMLS